MAKAFLGNARRKLYIGSGKVKKGYVGNTLVYSAGNIVTYHIDLNTSYKEELDSGISCLSPTTVPSKPGWTFVGWREDSSASGNVLSGKIMGDDPIDLYAVFSQDIVLTTGMNNTIYSQQTLPKYYNNGNISNPVFNVLNPSPAGAAFMGWSVSSTDATVSYSSINNLSLSESLVLYAVLTYENATVATIPGTYRVNINGGWFNTAPFVFVDEIDCSKYAGITATFIGESDANGGSADQTLYAEAGGTKIELASSHCNFDGQRNPVSFNKSVTIMFTQTSGSTSLTGYGTYDTYGFDHDGYIRIGDETATLIGKTSVG
ncbi:MAG: InlB B-repeat-containing protein [Acetatifactor sp.]|nr:InlB B-repeat-containing protein [Acetatifactor sp.]